MKTKSVIFVILASASLLIIGGSLQSYAISDGNDKSRSYSIETEYIIKIQKDLYHVQLKACALEEKIVTPTLVVTSDTETLKIPYTKILQPYTCKIFETTIKAKYSNSIKAELMESPYA